MFADWLEEQGRHEQADRVRETVGVRPEYSPIFRDWNLWRFIKTNGVMAPEWLIKKLCWDDRQWPTEAEGMAAILDAILEGPQS